MQFNETQWYVSQGIGVAGFALIALWFARTVWPDFKRSHREGLEAMASGFGLLGERLGGLERREAQRIRLGWLRELREQGMSPEEALLKAEEILGNGK